jgi:hypothetical protein
VSELVLAQDQTDQMDRTQRFAVIEQTIVQALGDQMGLLTFPRQPPTLVQDHLAGRIYLATLPLLAVVVVAVVPRSLAARVSNSK